MGFDVYGMNGIEVNGNEMKGKGLGDGIYHMAKEFSLGIQRRCLTD